MSRLRRRKKRPGSLSRLASIAETAMLALPVEEERPALEPIRVQASEIRPINGMPLPTFSHDDDGDDDGDLCGIFSFLTGGRPLKKNMTYNVRSEGEGFSDLRDFNYEEGEGGWKLEASWSAKGTGHVPTFIKMLGSMQGLFHQLINMAMGGRIEGQDVHDRSNNDGFRLLHERNGERR